MTIMTISPMQLDHVTKEEFGEFKEEIYEFRDEMTDFRDETREFKDEMMRFKDDVKSEFREVRSELKGYAFDGIERIKNYIDVFLKLIKYHI